MMLASVPTWDKDGELISDGARTYGWDARGRLASISGVASYSYDAFGRRSAMVPVSGAATAYFYDGPTIVQEQQGGMASANLLNGTGWDEHFTRATTGAGGGDLDRAGGRARLDGGADDFGGRGRDALWL